MGDIIPDSKMSRDEKHDQLIKIGFFNGDRDHSSVPLEDFQKHFDLVITGDGTLCPVMYTLQNLFAAKSSHHDYKEASQKIEGFKMLEESLANK